MKIFGSVRQCALAVLVATMAVTVAHAEDQVAEEARVTVGMRMAAPEAREASRAIQEQKAEEPAQAAMAQQFDVEEDRVSMGYGTDWGRQQWPYAVHGIATIGYYGELVEIEDGSTFSVASGSEWVVQGWRQGDHVQLLPNHGVFFGLFHSGYEFCLYNETTGETVDVNLAFGPFQFAETSWWISAIDDYNGIVWLQDGTAIYVDPSDMDLLYGWQPNDHIIMGYNDGWHSGQYPNIIVNVATVDYVRAQVAY